MSVCLVTGASGFLGRHLLESIGRVDPTCRRVALARHPADLISSPWFAELGVVDVIEGDLAALPSLAKHPSLKGLTGIYHCAAEVHHGRDHQERQRAINIGGTESVMALAARVKARVVFVSTSGASGCSLDPDFAPDEEAPTCDDVVGDWPYYASKIEA